MNIKMVEMEQEVVYIKRHSEKAIRTLSKMFGAVLVTGSRQVGKTTLLRQTVPSAHWVSLDDPIVLNTVQEEASTFLKSYELPVFIDEIQYAPQLFPSMKMLIDRSSEKGLFFLSGSQQFQMMRNVSESLAGRVGIITLPGISLREESGIDFTEPFIPTEEYFERRRESQSDISVKEVWRKIH